jgi:hypothetical protein
MRLLLTSAWLALWLLDAQALAQSPFDGKWRIDLDSSRRSQPSDIYLLQDGKYQCKSCDPSVEIPADGSETKITGDPCYDSVSIRVVDDRTTEETYKRGAATVGTSRMTVSSDGQTATVEWMESCNAKGDQITGKDVLGRVDKGPRGAHAISGSWRIVKSLNRSDNALVATIRLDGNTFEFADPAGQSYSAKLDGTETPLKGDISHTTVSLKRIGANTVEETDKREGKIVETTRFTVSPDGKTLTITIEKPNNGGTREFVAHKQEPTVPK